MMATTKERMQFAALLAREFHDRPVADVERFTNSLLRLAHTHGNLAVEECNGPGDYINRIPYPRAGELINEWQNRLEIRQARVNKRLRELCAAFRVPVILGGDPRGYTVKIQLPSGASNTWGGAEDGMGVPQ